MEHVVTRPIEPFAAADGTFEVHQVPAWRDNLIWLIVAGDEVAAVDGPEAGPVLEYLAERGLSLTAVFNTHTHADHIGINRDLEARGLLSSLRVICAKSTADAVPGLNEPVEEGDVVQLGGASFRVLSTPGHIDGHVSFVGSDVVFCGDTLFTGGCGYLFDGPPELMHQSLEKLAALDPSTRVCCAHEYTEDNLRFAYSVEPDNEALGARIRAVWALRAEGGCTVPSTIALERATNPFLRTSSAGLVETVSSAMPGHAVSSPAEIFAATRALKDRKLYREIEDSELPIG